MSRPGPPIALLLATLNSVAGLCKWLLWPSSVSSPPPPPPPLVLLLATALNSGAGLYVQALSSFCPPLGRGPPLVLLLAAPLWPRSVSSPPPPLVLLFAATCGWALCLGLVFLLVAPLNSVARLCVQALSSSCFFGGLCGCWPRTLTGRAPELCGWN